MSATKESKMAIREATRMHQHCEDPYYVGKTMLRQSYRVKLLEQVLEKTEAYLLAGQGYKEEAALVNAINKVNINSPLTASTKQSIYIN